MYLLFLFEFAAILHLGYTLDPCPLCPSVGDTILVSCCCESCENNCIYYLYVCDDFVDCSDGSDENQATCNEVDPCSSSPCLNGATCIPYPRTDKHVAFFICECPKQYEGLTCDQKSAAGNVSTLPSQQTLSPIYTTSLATSILTTKPQEQQTSSLIYSTSSFTLTTKPQELSSTSTLTTKPQESSPPSTLTTKTQELSSPVLSSSLSSSSLSQIASSSSPDHPASPSSPAGTLSETISVPFCSLCQNDATCTESEPLQCECLTGYEGIYCENLVVPDCSGSDPCLNGGSCITGLCQCVTGYDGNRCENDINDCNSNPCLNGGICEDLLNAYRCQCSSDFLGLNCEDDGDQCLDMPCLNGGTCIDLVKAYTCICPADLAGTNCELDAVDECLSGPCLNGGICRNLYGNYRCDCPEEWSGTNCEDDGDQCSNFPCLNSGVCIDQVLVYTCDCSGTGFAGLNCDEPINECESVPCKNQGSCVDLKDGYSCICLEGFTGTFCDSEIFECGSLPCENGGTCFDYVNGFSCQCESGFEGITCGDNIDDCGSNPCDNFAICVDKINSYECSCAPGYEGTLCQEEIDECGSDPCQNGADCEDFVNSFSCTCSPGFEGILCEIETNECLSNPCHNGTCNDLFNLFACTCLNGFSGTTCEVDIDDCEGSPCLNGGVCVDGVAEYQCVCVEGYSGSSCETEIQECISNPCQQGICVDLVNEFSCDCSAGYIGTLCEIDLNECDSTPCHNSGTCEDLVNAYRCSCLPSFGGTNCDVLIDVCLSNPCKNEATCSNVGDGSFTCICADGFTNTLCEIEINECEDSNICPTGCIDLVNGFICEEIMDICLPNPCKNDGFCCQLGVTGCPLTLDVGEYGCFCKNGFSGDHCEITVDECLALPNNPCQNNGLCIDAVGTYSCLCQVGFTGATCDLRIPCNPDPCIHGICQEIGDTYICSCDVGYTDKNCSTEIKLCDTLPCQNNGFCIDNDDDSYTCECLENFVGSNCETQVTSCSSNPCIQGDCGLSGDDYYCDCDLGYTGINCEILVLPCDSRPCQNDGTCIDQVNKYLCQCSANFNGLNCEIPIVFTTPKVTTNDFTQPKTTTVTHSTAQSTTITTTQSTTLSTTQSTTKSSSQSVESSSTKLLVSTNTILKTTNTPDPCQDSPCSDNGICSSNVNLLTGELFTCACLSGYTGVYCEIAVTSCSPNPCQNGGTCLIDSLGPFCLCNVGFLGNWCESIEGGVCSPSPCLNGGVCLDINGQVYCECTGDYSGDYCDEISLGCDSNPCNGGDCLEDASGNAVCRCPPGFIGETCSEPDACISQPCSNGATCISNTDGFSCLCVEGYEGILCDVKQPACFQQNLCLNGATCIDNGSIDLYTCSCATGYTGLNCEDNVDDCVSHSCQNGDCFDLTNSYMCICFTGYTGLLCDIAYTCADDPCTEAATCLDASDPTYGTAYTCLCTAEYVGTNCEDFNYCLSNPCPLDVTCKNLPTEFFCDYCADAPCQNNATCVINVLTESGYECLCTTGFIGEICQTEVNECELLNPCSNLATCIDQVNGYECICPMAPDYYYGEMCELSACDNNLCSLNSQCLATNETEYICLCPVGTIGTYCSQSVDIQIPQFEGSGFLEYFHTFTRPLSLLISFQTAMSDNNILFYALSISSDDNYLAIYLQSGYLVFIMTLDGMEISFKSQNSYYADNIFHLIQIEESAAYLLMNIDNSDNTFVDHKNSVLSGSLAVFIAGINIQTMILPPLLISFNGLIGCVGDLQLSGQSIDLLNDYTSGANVDNCFVGVCDFVTCNGHGQCIEESGTAYTCLCEIEYSGQDCEIAVCETEQCLHGGTCFATADGPTFCKCPLGYAGPLCESSVSVNISSFYNNSYIKFPILGENPILDVLTISIQFKAEQEGGLLLYSMQDNNILGDFFALALTENMVSFQYNLGGTTGSINSEPIALESWIEVNIARNGKESVMNVTGQSSKSGMSGGSLQSLNVEPVVFVGGMDDLSAATLRTQVTTGFYGCILSLTIQEYEYSFSNTEAISGANVAQCDSDLCQAEPCQNEGTCLSSPGSYTCSCTNDYFGNNCEESIDYCMDNNQCAAGSTCVSDASSEGFFCLCPFNRKGALCDQQQELNDITPEFFSSSYLAFTPPSSIHTETSFKMKIRAGSGTGLILYMEGDSDFLSLAIFDNIIQLRFNLGSGTAIISSIKVDLNTWLDISVERHENEGILNVGSVTYQGESAGTSIGLTVSSNLYVGGVPDYNQINSDVGVFTGFLGCIENFEAGTGSVSWSDVIDGVNIDNCISSPCSNSPCMNGGECQILDDLLWQCVCPLFWTGELCTSASTINVPSFESEWSYLVYSNIITSTSKNDILIEFKPLTNDGIIFWNNLLDDFIGVGLVNQTLIFVFSLGSGEEAIIESKSPMSLDTWHVVHAWQSISDGSLNVDNEVINTTGQYFGTSTGLNMNTINYFGGVPSSIIFPTAVPFNKNYYGCIRSLKINGKAIDLSMPSEGRDVGECLDSLCSLNHNCFQGSTCQVDVNFEIGYTCLCPVGYSGILCNVSTCENLEPDLECKNGGQCYIDELGHTACDCTYLYSGVLCEQDFIFLIPYFNGQGYLEYPQEIISSDATYNGFSLLIRFEIYGSNSLILWNGEGISSDFIALGTNDGFIEFVYNLGSDTEVLTANTLNLQNDQWYIINVNRNGNSASMTIQDIQGFSYNYEIVSSSTQQGLNSIGTSLYLGNVPDDALQLTGRYSSGLVGCIAQFATILNPGDEALTAVNIQQQAVGGSGITECNL